MSQVNFFMTAKDEATFLDFIFSRMDTHVLTGRFFDMQNPVPIVCKDDIGNIEVLTLLNKEIMPEPIVSRSSGSVYLFEVFRDPFIEFSRSRISKTRLLSGRIYAKIGWLQPTESNAIYKSWYGSIERWLKKSYRRVDKIWWFGPDAWEWSMAGGICCFGDELAFATSLATADKSWVEA